MRNSLTTEYVKVIKINKEDYDFINANKKKKSAAGFLKEIIKEHKNGLKELHD